MKLITGLDVKEMAVVQGRLYVLPDNGAVWRFEDWTNATNTWTQLSGNDILDMWVVGNLLYVQVNNGTTWYWDGSTWTQQVIRFL